MSILATKLYIPPPRSKLVRRTRLIERLNEGKHRKLTLVSAPAGFGKTMLVSEWIAGCKRPAAWFSMDEGDNDPIRFLNYFVSALQTISAGVIGGVLGVLQSTQPPPTESILTILLNGITAIPGDFTLVLDDYHAIDTKPVDEVLTFLLDHLSSFIKSFNGSHYFVMDYLVEEVLQQQPESVQTFLLRTSILDRLCGPLYDAVLPDPSASGQETLEYLQHANLFIVPMDNERRWYRYHHLFADLLRQRLSRSAAVSAKGEGKGAAEYHNRASQWYKDNDYPVATRFGVSAPR